jgi:Domain of Unknown Function with PDB structure (DUF3857)
MSIRRLSSLFVYPILLAGFTLVLSNAAHAVLGFKPVNPDELKMTSEPLAPGAPAIILDREVNRDDLGRNSRGGLQVQGNTSTRYEEDYSRIKILTEEGRKFGEVEIPLLAGYHDITGIRARTIRPDGTIEDFNGQIFEKTIFKRKGLKYQAKTFTLPDVQVGSIIEYYYTLNFNGYGIWFSNWILSQDLFQKHASFTLRPYTVEGSHVNLRWSEHLPPGMPEPKQGPDGIVRLEVNNVPAFHSEDFMPPENQLKARVDFIYSYDALDPDINHFWKKAGKRRDEELESFVSKRGALQDALAKIVSPSDSPEVKLQKIYARVQQLRNTSYEVEKTEEQKKQEKEKDLPNAEEVLKRGYGTEEQLNWLFLGLARAAGFDANGAALPDRSEFFFNPQLMDPNRLARTAVLIKLNNKDEYFAPGVEYAPYGILPWEETGVQGLRLSKDGGSWIQTSVPDSSLSEIQRKADLRLSDSGDLEGKLTVTYTGLEGLRRRLDERNEDDVSRKKYLENEVRQYIPVASEVKLVNTPEWTSSAHPLQAEFDVKVPGWMTRGGRLALCPVGLFGGSERHVFDQAERVNPIYFDFPSEQVDDITIELPAGWQVGTVPKSLDQDYHVVAYSVGAENDKTTLHLRRKLNVNIVEMDTKYYGPIRSFFQGVRAGDSEQVVLQPGTAVGSN